MSKKTRKMRHALLMSVISMMLCCAMLVGTTFAWFTDEVSSTGNKIQSGTLKVDLELLDKTTKQWESIKTSQEAIFDYDLWEPGYVDVKVLKIENEGTLALKWYASFVSDEKLSILADVIDVYVCPSADELEYPDDRNLEGYTKVGTVAEFVNTIEKTTYGTLLPKESDGNGGVAYLGIALKMQETAGNEYQDLTLGEFDIRISATQLTYEKDSFDDQYDAGAIFYDKLVTSDAELQAAVQDPNVKTIAISGKLTYDWGNVNDGATALKGITLFGYNGTADSITFKGLGSDNDIPNVTLKNITVSDATLSATENNWEYTYLEFNSLTANNVVFESGILLNGNSKLTDCSVNSKANEYGVWILDGNATLNNCTFTNARGVKIHEEYSTGDHVNDVETVVIDGCTFMNLSEKPGVAIDSDNDTQITIKNSTFINCQAGENGDDDVAYIYETKNTVPALENNTVVKPVDTTDELKDALAAGENVVLTGDITMSAGNITVATGTKAVIDLGGNDLTVTNTDTTPAFLKVEGDLTITGEGNVAVRQINTYEGSNLTLGEGVTIKTSNAYAINNSGTTKINGATIEHTGTNHAIQNNGTLTIDDATITSTSASNISTINSTGGTVTINGGTFTHNGSMGSVIGDPYGNSEFIINGGTFTKINGDSLVNVGDAKLTINGGTFDATSMFSNLDTNITINAGVFKNNAKITDYGFGSISSMIPATSTATTNADGSITVTVNN